MATLAKGNYVSFGGKVWRVIDPATNYLVLNSTVTNLAFDPDSTNSYNPLDSNNIAYYLNNTYYNGLTNKEWIADTVWGIGNETNPSSQTVTAKIAFISKSEYEANRGSVFPTNGEGYFWWTRTKYGSSTTQVWGVNDVGNVAAQGTGVSGVIQTRPVIKLKTGLIVTTGAGTSASPYNITYNQAPALTLTNPADNQVLSEGNSYNVQGSATDADNGNVVTIKYKINNGTTRALNSGVSNGSTPISFAKTLTYSNKRLWDGATDITGADLAEGTNHTLIVWAEDDQGGVSAMVTRTFTVVWNRPPVISGTNENLGTISTAPSKAYTVTEPENDTFTITEKINGTVIRSFAGTAGQQNTITIPHDLWIRLDLGVSHSLIVEATDNKGLTSTRTYTFTRTETHIEFKLKYDNPAIAALFTLDGMPDRVLVTLEKFLPQGADIESVKVCNNALDVSPTWEDATGAVKGGRGYLFTNQTKTAADWRIGVWVVLAKGTATERVILDGYGGAYD